jgi:hypothetical protein
MQPVIKHLPLVDTVSGVDQLDHRRAWHERGPGGLGVAALVIAFAAGVLITLIVVCFSL